MKRGLQTDGATHRIERTGKFDQKTVAGILDLLAAMSLEQRPEQVPLLFYETESERLIPLHQRAVADHVGKHDRHETAL